MWLDLHNSNPCSLRSTIYSHGLWVYTWFGWLTFSAFLHFSHLKEVTKLAKNSFFRRWRERGSHQIVCLLFMLIEQYILQAKIISLLFVGKEAQYFSVQPGNQNSQKIKETFTKLSNRDHFCFGRPPQSTVYRFEV